MDSLRSRTSSAAPNKEFYIPSSNSKPIYKPSKADRDEIPGFWDGLGGGLNLVKGEGRVLAGLLVLGSVVRFWKLGDPSSVV